MAFSGMLRRATLVRTDVSEEFSASFIRATRIGELETTLAVTINRRTLRASVDSYGYVPRSPILVTLMLEALSSSETSVLTRPTRRHIPEDAVFQAINKPEVDVYHVLLKRGMYGIVFRTREFFLTTALRTSNATNEVAVESSCVFCPRSTGDRVLQRRVFSLEHNFVFCSVVTVAVGGWSYLAAYL
jgi:hypothetical protein